MNKFPVFLDLTSRKCLVIGGGAVAERKVKLLLECQAEVTIVSPDLTPFLKELFDKGRINYHARNFIPEDIEGKFFVISAAGDAEVNNFLNKQCQIKGFLLNIVDEPEKGNAYIPATVKRGKFQIAVSTSGASPLFARRIRERLEKEYGPEYERFTQLMAEIRPEVLRNVSDANKRHEIFKELVDSDILELLKDGNEEKVKERINKCLSW